VVQRKGGAVLTFAPPPKPAARSRLIIGDCGPSDSALAASSGWRLRRPAADRPAARCASRDLCSGGAPRRYPPSEESGQTGTSAGTRRGRAGGENNGERPVPNLTPSGL